MKTLLSAILFTILFGVLGWLLVIVFVADNWLPISLFIIGYIFRKQIAAWLCKLSGAPDELGNDQ